MNMETGLLEVHWGIEMSQNRLYTAQENATLRNKSTGTLSLRSTNMCRHQFKRSRRLLTASRPHETAAISVTDRTHTYIRQTDFNLPHHTPSVLKRFRSVVLVVVVVVVVVVYLLIKHV